ncbi:MAG: EAL domain-containing protein, partial [Paucibacter sp.]|nr:EAL domain-containing protein [Roseateles sp.]
AQLSLSQSLIQIVHKERAGLQVAGQLMAALHELPKLRPPSDASASAELPRRELLQRLELAREQIALRPELPAQLAASVAELQADLQRQGSAAAPVAALLQIQAQLRQMLEVVLDHSTLILDPGVDTYYLITATLQQGVELAVLLQGLEQAPTPALIARSLRSIRQSLAKVAAANPDRAAGLTESLTQLESLLLSETGLAADTDAAAQQRAALAEWLVAAMDQLDRALEARAKALRNTQLQQLFLLLGFVLAAALLGRQIIREYQTRTEEQAHRSKMLDHAEELAKIGCAETDLMSDTVKWTTGMFRLFGEPVSRDLIDPDWLYLRVPRNERELIQRNSQAVTPERAGEFLHRIQRADGEWRTVVHRAVVDLDSHGWPRRALTILQDVTEQKDAEQRIQLLDNCCPITGLLNRKALLDRLEQVGHEQARHALMVLQINQLGMVMDSLGYEGGDRLLQWVAGRLRETAREGSALAHLGQGEFACLLPIAQESDELLLQQAQAQCEQLSQTVQLGEIDLSLSCSLGLSCSPQDGAQGQKLLHQAQAAMARARELGENQVSRYDAIAHAKVVSRLSMETALRRALEQGGLHLHFQPQVELRQGLIRGAEVLLRWTDPVRGEVPPVEFIPVAEESGLIIELGEWVLRAACVQAVAWQRAGMRPVRLAVNLSARQLQLPDIAWRIQNILRETGMDPCHLGLEITESQFIDENPHLVRALASMKAIGVEISLDDFGTGYSNLSYLRRLPIDVVKIDRSIVHDVAAAAHDVSITRAVINMAHSLQLRVLAEGVETEGQLALLMAHGCDEIQGYYFSRALSVEAFEALMRDEKRLPEHLFASQRKRVLLLVDDEENIVSSLRRLLRRDGYQILTASSGNEGLQLLAEHDVDVIISD